MTARVREHQSQDTDKNSNPGQTCFVPPERGVKEDFPVTHLRSGLYHFCII